MEVLGGRRAISTSYGSLINNYSSPGHVLQYILDSKNLPQDGSAVDILLSVRKIENNSAGGVYEIVSRRQEGEANPLRSENGALRTIQQSAFYRRHLKSRWYTIAARLYTHPAARQPTMVSSVRDNTRVSGTLCHTVVTDDIEDDPAGVHAVKTARILAGQGTRRQEAEVPHGSWDRSWSVPLSRQGIWGAIEYGAVRHINGRRVVINKSIAKLYWTSPGCFVIRDGHDEWKVVRIYTAQGMSGGHYRTAEVVRVAGWGRGGPESGSAHSEAAKSARLSQYGFMY